MNDEQIMELGMFCKGILSDPRYQALEQLFGQQLAADLLSTQPHETKKREGHYAAYQGYGEFKALMSKFVEAYTTLLQQQEIDNRTDPSS